MWERIAMCLGRSSGSKGAKAAKCTINIADLQSRVPPNQMKYFKRFVEMREGYKSRLQKFPAELPKIDWDFYKKNVPKDKVDWVSKFEKKYDKLDSMFANRHSLIDTSKYFVEVEEQTKQVQEQVKEYKKRSDARIAELQKQIDKLKPMKPYTEMTMEEFCLARPDVAPDFINKPTFWPHTPEEQRPGPSDPDAHYKQSMDSGGSKTKPKPPSPNLPAGADPTDGKTESSPASEAMKEFSLDLPKDLPKEETPSPEEAKSGVVIKAVELAMLWADKAVKTCQMIVQKIDEKRKEGTGGTAPVVKSAEPIAKQPEPVGEDSFQSRETISNICHKTIIRGEDTKKADVKSHHLDLDNLGETISVDQRISEEAAGQLDKKEKVCDRDEKIKEKLPCESDSICEKDKKEKMIRKDDAEEAKVGKPDPKGEEVEKEGNVHKPDPKGEEVEKEGNVCKPDPKGEELEKEANVRKPDPKGKEVHKEGNVCKPDPKVEEVHKEENVCKPDPKGEELEKEVNVRKPDPKGEEVHKEGNVCKPDPKGEEVHKEANVCKPDPKREEVSVKSASEVVSMAQDLLKDEGFREIIRTTFDAGSGGKINEPISTFSNITPAQMESFEAKPMPIASASAGPGSKELTELQRFKEIKLMHDSFDPGKCEVMNRERESQLLEDIRKEKEKAMQTKSTSSDDDDSTTIKQDLVVEKVGPKPAQKVVCSKDDGGQPEPSKLGSLNVEDVAKFVFETATSAAILLSDAKKTLEKTQAAMGGNREEVKSAYVLAEKLVSQALDKAQMALKSAQSLAKESGMDKDAIALIEKNMMLAQLMVSRAKAMKEEIVRLLNDLKLH